MLQPYIENEWPNFDEYTIGMEENEWEEDDVKEFTRLVEQLEGAQKPTKEELETICKSREKPRLD